MSTDPFKRRARVSKRTSRRAPISLISEGTSLGPLYVFFRRFLIALAITSTLLVIAVTAGNRLIEAKLGAVRRVHLRTLAASPVGENYLLVGSDTRAGALSPAEKSALCDPVQGCQSGQRSDTIMVLHVEPAARRALLVSLPRDLLVTVPGVGKSKINAAFNSDLGGGPQRVIDTLTQDFGIKINHYVAVDFNAFRGVVNAIGGVRLAFPNPTRDEYSGLSVPKAGCVAFNGDAALAYVRARSYEIQDPATGDWRYADSVPDVGRIRRQQSFIRDVLTLAVQKSLANPLNANRIADRVIADLTLDQAFSKKELLGLIGAFRTVNANDPTALDTQTFPWHEGPLFDGQAVLYPQDDTPDGKALLARLNDFSHNEPVAPTVKPSAVKVQVLNAAGRAGVAAAAQASLVKLGFRGVGNPDNYPGGPLAETEVHYPTGELSQAQLVLKYIAPSAKLVTDASRKNSTITLVIGQDFQQVTGAPRTSDSSPPAAKTGTGRPSAEVAPTADATPC